MLLPLRVRIEKDIIVRIHRVLKGRGKINVSVGTEVSPPDIIGSASFSPGFRTFNLATLLGVPPSEAQKYLQKSIGEKVYLGELLAYHDSLFGGKKVVISPADGVLDLLNPKTGDVRMSFLPKKEDLPAGFYGIVEMVDPEKGQVIIKTQASLIHGSFGSGKIRDGILHTVSTRDELLTASLITHKYKDKILLGGSLVYKDAISSAISEGVSGIITGGINAKDYKGMAGGRLSFPKKIDSDIGISLVVCEGFGPISVGLDMVGLLKDFEGRFVSIDGNKGMIYLPSFESESMTKIRKTSLGPIKGLDQTLLEDSSRVAELTPGMKVRIIGNSYIGEQGTVVSIDKTPTHMSSGISAYLVTVESRKRKVKVPVANLEIIL